MRAQKTADDGRRKTDARSNAINPSTYKPGAPLSSCAAFLSRLAAPALVALAALPLSAQSPARLASQAQSAFLQGHPEEAATLYRAALQAESNADRRALIQYDLGTSLLQAKRQAEARDALMLALSANSASLKERAFYNLAQALAQAGEREKAMEALRQCLAIEPSNHDAALFYEWLLKQQPPPPEPPPPDKQPPPPAPKPPDLLEQLPTPPPKELQDQVRNDNPTPPGMKPW